ncbi:hypothetical protein JQ634_30215 [Bradyrhizobium sp. AUGA SZCCT0240]|uniref:hypothetical protein n=1 Tax=Bradyrhizobium sp. AUGA SZCCT0240 TaxID=2807669 RepID=UPI001BAA0029|nr:hypothetical protein [Bradyrhizobium sp. AUGA SZCCT0240]MBR1257950.1 hypothetical protein [Bradyrhizobium sp. AUGA SZCCT0240]
MSEYGRQVDRKHVLFDNPSIMRRAQVMRPGCFGETNGARAVATEGWMKLAKAAGG